MWGYALVRDISRGSISCCCVVVCRDRLRTTSNCVSKMMGSAAISYACDTGQEKPPMEATTVQSDEEEKVEFLTKDRPTDV